MVLDNQISLQRLVFKLKTLSILLLCLITVDRLKIKTLQNGIQLVFSWHLFKQFNSWKVRQPALFRTFTTKLAKIPLKSTRNYSTVSRTRQIPEWSEGYRLHFCFKHFCRINWNCLTKIQIDVKIRISSDAMIY